MDTIYNLCYGICLYKSEKCIIKTFNLLNFYKVQCNHFHCISVQTFHSVWYLYYIFEIIIKIAVWNFWKLVFDIFRLGRVKYNFEPQMNIERIVNLYSLTIFFDKETHNNYHLGLWYYCHNCCQNSVRVNVIIFSVIDSKVSCNRKWLNLIRHANVV